MVAPSGDAALAIVKAERGIDLVFTDLVMPEGSTAWHWPRKSGGSAAAVKIVFTSGYLGHAALKQRLPDRQEVFVHKPYRTRELAAAIERALAD